MASQNPSRLVQEKLEILVADRLVGIHQTGLERRIALLRSLLDWCNEEEEAAFQDGSVLARWIHDGVSKATLAACESGAAAREALYAREFERRLLAAVW